MARSLLCLSLMYCIAFLSALPAKAAGQTRPVQGTVVMARGGAQPLYLWNATDYVIQLVSDKVLGDDGMHALEASAIAALLVKSAGSTAKSVTIRVVYAKTGAVSPTYGTPTFAGMENVLTLSVPRQELPKMAGAWEAALASGKTPAGVRLNVTGSLPPK